MAAKDKAQELIDKYYQIAESIEWTDKKTSKKAENFNDKLGQDVLIYWHELAKRSALIAVDEIIKSEPTYTSSIFQGSFLKSDNTEYWNEVKQEIINQ